MFFLQTEERDGFHNFTFRVRLTQPSHGLADSLGMRMARILGVGCVHHVIARFVDRSWQLVGDQEREQYLGRLATAMARARWRLIGYALMSNHIHLLAVAEDKPLEAWAKPVHVGMAMWLNRRFGRTGPVFAGRPYCEIVAPPAVPIVLAYLHNNPVRARVVRSAVDSTWTSHRAYLGIDAPAPGLDVPYGLMVSGFVDDAGGRREFAAWVHACANSAGQGVAPRAEIVTLLSDVRSRLGAGMALGTATRDVKGAVFPLLAPAQRAPHRRIELDPQDVIRAVFAASGVDLRQFHAGRPRSVSRARRAALLLWSDTHLPRSIMVRALGMSAVAATQLIDRTAAADTKLVQILAKARDILIPETGAEELWSAGYDRQRKVKL